MTAETFSAGDTVAAAVSLGVAVVSLAVLVNFRNPDEITSFKYDNSHHWDLVLWERDRLQAIAKGLGGAAIAFLSVVFGAVLKADIASVVPLIWIVGCLLGVVGSLLAAFLFYCGAERWARGYYNKSPSLS